jgi:hypothetical protein
MPTKQSVTLVFQDPSGTAIAGGTVTIRLLYDISAAASNGPQISAGIVVSGTLDSSGTITVDLWPNDVLVPANSNYQVKAYTALGQPAWSGTLIVTS